ncbi:MAG TPA: TonB-dependent receptor plug domain-containing protein [Opitutaceae bacterium]|nr:TonB-dependent receptor plug domain-containing protein [Opitutaceae bacterium]
MHVPSILRNRRSLALAASFSLMLHPGFAQTATNSPNDPKTDKDEETIVLSPFMVDAGKDEGYQATATLAGSRINTDLKDVPQSITVVTKQFLTDVSAVSVNDILTYTANTEGTRDFTSSQQSLGRPSDDVARNPNSANRIRGLAAADITRDYFYSINTWAGFDTYNLDEVTIVRGPNSILAGLGSPAGIINYSPQLANLNGSHNQLSYRFGSFGDQRATLNSNYVVKKDFFAVRVAAAYSERGFEQKPSWNHDNRLYAALAFRPWSKTTLRASFEKVRINSNNPNTITPGDGISQWLQVGKPIYDSTSTAPIATGLSANTNGPVLLFDSAGKLEGAYSNTATGYTYFAQNLDNVGIWEAPSMSNDQYISLSRMNLNPSLQHLGQKTFNISLDQEIFKGLYANVAYVHETVDNEFLDLFRTEYAIYSVDVNKYLPGGAPNPHFLETFMQFRGLDNRQTDHNTNRVIRGTLSYDLDLTKYNKWFGQYKLTGFAEDRRTETDHMQYNARQIGGSDESVIYRYYMGGTAANNYQAQSVPLHPMLYQNVPYLPNLGTVNSFYGLKSNTKNLVKLQTEAAVAQAFLWDGKIVGTAGIRRDHDNGQFATGASSAPFTVTPAGPYPTSGDKDYNPTIAKNTKTYGGVFHALKWLSVHYNYSENFIPNAGAIDLLGNTTPSPTGTTREYGFSVNTPDGKLNAKVNWFKTVAANAPAAAANFPLAQWTIPYMENEFMPNLAAQAGIQYQKYMSPSINQGSSYGNTVGDARLANGYTANEVAKGIELELTYNVTKNWRLMANVSKQDVKQTNIATGLTDFIENRLAYWQSIPALWTGPYTYTGGGWGVGRTGQQQWNSDNAFYYLSYKSAEGQPSTQLAKWHASAITNYTFSEGFLKGVSIGGGARYIEKAIIGNPAIKDASGTVVALDLDHPYTTPGYIAFDVWVGYKRKLYRKSDISFQLNVRDLQENGGVRAIVANSDGTPAAYRILDPRTWYLTTTIDF